LYFWASSPAKQALPSFHVLDTRSDARHRRKQDLPRLCGGKWLEVLHRPQVFGSTAGNGAQGAVSEVPDDTASRAEQDGRIEGNPMPQFVVLIHSDADARPPAQVADERAAHDRHAQELADSGSMTVAYALTPPVEAVAIRGGTASAGPLLDGPPHVAGFYVVEAPDLEAAVAIARGNPAARSGAGVEVRPVEGGGVIRG
jgi:hypothetical protein